MEMTRGRVRCARPRSQWYEPLRSGLGEGA
jgi:hypothetical protein